jgi:hypothetical protein
LICNGIGSIIHQLLNRLKRHFFVDFPQNSVALLKSKHNIFLHQCKFNRLCLKVRNVRKWGVCTSCSSVSSCWSAFTRTCSWYFRRRRIRRAFDLLPWARASLATCFSRFRTVCIRFWYWWSLSRCIFRSRIARSVISDDVWGDWYLVQ